MCKRILCGRLDLAYYFDRLALLYDAFLLEYFEWYVDAWWNFWFISQHSNLPKVFWGKKQIIIKYCYCWHLKLNILTWQMWQNQTSNLFPYVFVQSWVSVSTTWPRFSQWVYNFWSSNIWVKSDARNYCLGETIIITVLLACCYLWELYSELHLFFHTCFND